LFFHRSNPHPVEKSVEMYIYKGFFMVELVENCLEIQAGNFLVNLDVENFEYVHVIKPPSNVTKSPLCKRGAMQHSRSLSLPCAKGGGMP